MHRHIPLLPSFAKRYGFNHRTYNMNSVWSLRNINLAIDDISCHSRNNSLLGSQVQVADISQQRFNSGGNASNWKNSMSDAMKSVEAIVTQLSDLPSSNLFEAPSLDAIEKLRLVEDRLPRALFVKGKGLFRSLENNVTRGNVRPSGKHGVQISKFLERILIVYNHVSMIRHAFGRTNEDGDKLYVYDECVRILDWMEQRNLNWRSHCELAISCACHEDRFDDAASLFWNLIDPEAGGHPTEVAVDNPLGLFAVARSCQDQGLPAAEHVFDAVLRLSMVSPIDQPTYVLAAGVALGHAGEWEASVQYLRNNSSSQELGFALVASVMRTYLLCDRPTVMNKLFMMEFTNSPSKSCEFPLRLFRLLLWGCILLLLGESKQLRSSCFAMRHSKTGEYFSCVRQSYRALCILLLWGCILLLLGSKQFEFPLFPGCLSLLAESEILQVLLLCMRNASLVATSKHHHKLARISRRRGKRKETTTAISQLWVYE